MGFAEGQLVQTESGNAASVEEVPEGERVLCRDKEDFTRVSFVPVTLALRPDKLKKVVMVKVRPEGADEGGKGLSVCVRWNQEESW